MKPQLGQNPHSHRLQGKSAAHGGAPQLIETDSIGLIALIFLKHCKLCAGKRSSDRVILWACHSFSLFIMAQIQLQMKWKGIRSGLRRFKRCLQTRNLSLSGWHSALGARKAEASTGSQNGSWNCSMISLRCTPWRNAQIQWGLPSAALGWMGPHNMFLILQW